MLKIYYNPRCKICSQSLSLLKEKGFDPLIVDYLKKPLSSSELKKLLVKLNMKPREIIRENEIIFKEKFKGKNFTDEEWIKIILEYPILMQRPIIEKEYKAVIGRPIENIHDFILKTKINENKN